MDRPPVSIFEGIVPQPNEAGKKLVPVGETEMKERLERLIWVSGNDTASAVMHEIAHEEISLTEAAERFVRQCLVFTADCYRAEIAAQKVERNIQEMEIPEENR